MVDRYVTATPEDTFSPNTPAAGDRLLDKSNNEYVKTSHVLTKIVDLPLAVWSNTVGVISNLAVGTTPSIWVKSFDATASRLSTCIRLGPNWDTGTDPKLVIHQNLASNYASDTRLQWQVDYRVVTAAANGRLVTGTNTTSIGSNNTGASGTNGQDSITKIEISLARAATGNVLNANDLIFMDLSCDELQVPRYFLAHAQFEYTQLRK